MSPICQKRASVRRRHVILAPSSARGSIAVRTAGQGPRGYEQMLREMQRLRGRIALSEGAIQVSQLTADGRDASPIDHLAWHLLTLDEDGSVGGCVRMLVHPRNANFDGLMVSHSALASCPERGPALRLAVEAELADAGRAGAAVVEIGGWVLTETMRCSTEAVRLALGVWAWGRMIGGAVGIATATIRNHSACILSRIGGRPLRHRGESIPQYFEPKYGCDIQILRFDSNSYSLRYQDIVEGLCDELDISPLLTADGGSEYALNGLYQAIHSSQPALVSQSCLA